MAKVVETEALGRTYRTRSTGVTALRDLSISIHAGEFVAIMGASGSGKSTLLNILGLLDSPTSGTYRLDGVEVHRLPPNGRSDIRSRKIGFVFQNFNLLPRSTALENVELPLIYGDVRARERKSRAREALQAVGLGDREDHWPQQLSGGEQQRVAIARAIVNRPILMLADEPTGALDSQTGALILDLFQELNLAGRTIVMVTHDSEVASRAGRIIRLRDGALVSDSVTTAHVTPPLKLEIPQALTTAGAS